MESPIAPTTWIWSGRLQSSRYRLCQRGGGGGLQIVYSCRVTARGQFRTLAEVGHIRPIPFVYQGLRRDERVGNHGSGSCYEREDRCREKHDTRAALGVGDLQAGFV